MMPSTACKRDKTYTLGYEVYDVSPLPHYFEEIYGHIKGIEAIGPRGDQNYFWYSKDGQGSAYYELGEQKLSAKSTYEVLSNPARRASYFDGVGEVLAKVKDWSEEADSLDLGSLTTEQVFGHASMLWQLDADIFSYYLISQAYRLQLFEDEVRWELQKRIAKVRVDDYLARLVASPEITENVKEELGWAKLVLAAKDFYGDDLDGQVLKRDKKLYDALRHHFNEFKPLHLGDGKWDIDFNEEVDRFLKDMKKPADDFIRRIKEIETHPENVLREQKRLISELQLADTTVKTISFLSDISHLRYAMRVRGFILLIYYMIKMTNELAERLGYENNVNLSFLTHEELEHTKSTGKAVVPLTELKKRRGGHDEYMVRIDDGRVEYHYGEQAGALFAQMVPPVDHSERTELSGVVAYSGHVRATATIYNWGDDMEAAIRSVKEHPILIAGQTRPAMMPLIRMAKGIVTDEGGVTSHAAIVARELGIPTIINTGTGTKVFSTGDLVELDTETATVRKVAL